MDHLQLAHSLADAFNALADEVQILADRKTVLEHKLRFAHEQFQSLADKYAPATVDIAETLARLQLPPYTSLDDTAPVPIPRRRSSPQPIHQIALIIRDGRRVANKLVSIGPPSKATATSRESLSYTSQDETSMSTALEQDFTVEGKKGNLQCPFQKSNPANHDERSKHSVGTVPHGSADDPICAAMSEDATSPGAHGPGYSKCPIRFMDKHSPEEIAHYVETHKHQIPRSHEVCMRRYQRNETQMKKLDSKYGNIVSMIEDLSHLHQPMLPEPEEAEQQPSVGRDANLRVEHWAQAVSHTADSDVIETGISSSREDRQGHFERILKEVRVGESPSRPWGISVPVYEPSDRGEGRPSSPPPAPVRIPSTHHADRPTATGDAARKCPFGHTRPEAASARPQPSTSRPDANFSPAERGAKTAPSTPTKCAAPAPLTFPSPSHPTFINPDTVKAEGQGGPQMIFTGPVFIGYPVEQAMEFMKSYRGSL